LFFDPGKHRADVNPSAVPMDSTSSTPLLSDFNSLIAHLGAQPVLQRNIGLIIDLAVPPPSGLNFPNQAYPQPFNTTVFANVNPGSPPPALPSTYLSQYPQANNSASPISFVTPAI